MLRYLPGLAAILAALFTLTASTAAAQGRAFSQFGDANPKPGAVAPDFTCKTDTGEDFQLDVICKERPVLLFFGSCT